MKTATTTVSVANPGQLWLQAKAEFIEQEERALRPRPRPSEITARIGTIEDPKLGACLEVLILNKVRGVTRRVRAQPAQKLLPPPTTRLIA